MNAFPRAISPIPIPFPTPIMKTCNALRTAFWAAALVFGLCRPGAVLAAGPNPPDLLSYQGYVTDSAGVPLASTSAGPRNYDAVFRIYASSQGGAAIWAEQQTITVDRGHFSVMLGEGTGIEILPKPSLTDIFSGLDASDRFIGITVKGLTTPDSEIAPRLRLLASPYAFLARRAVAVVNDAGQSLLNATTGGLIVNQSIGIQYSTPHFPLSLGNSLGNTKLALWDGSATAAFGFGIQASQFRIHLNSPSDRFSFLNAPNGSEVVTITGGGRMGIGTSAPKAFLHNRGEYYGWGHVYLYAYEGDGVSGTAYLQARDDSTTSNVGLQIRTKKGAGLTEAVHVNPDGNVGIRRGADATRALDVNGTARATAFEGNGIIPVGGIIMWSGTTVPAGWALCNGANGTPNLVDRFVLGGTTSTVNQTGGSSSVTLSEANLPPHTHNFSVGTVGYAAVYNGSAEATRAPGNGRNNGTQTQGTGSTGSGTAFSIMPPFYRLAYIMRVN